jgi:hypothetical protein
MEPQFFILFRCLYAREELLPNKSDHSRSAFSNEFRQLGH